MWNNYYKSGDLSLNVELSTYCNARCPQCSRTDQNDVNKKKHWVPLTSVTLEQFQNWIPNPDKIANFHFAGKFGDPGMCKDLYEIVKYILDHSTDTRVFVNTNGSLRDEEFWFNLGSLGSRLTIIYDVDGIDQEMHGFYRRGTDLQKILNHIEVTCQTPANVRVFSVMFKHNEDYLEQIQDMCRDLGVVDFDSVESNNFKDGSTYDFIDENGTRQTLEQITRKDREQGFDRTNRIIRDHRHEMYNDIECAASKEMNLEVSAGGMVMPCCHLSALENHTFMGYNKDDAYLSTHGDYELNPMLSEYIERSADFNLNNKTLDEIVNDIWYVENLKQSWSSEETAAFACKKICGKCK